MIRALGFLLRLYSYIFHLLLSVFLLGVASISVASHQTLNMRMLPFTQDAMVRDVSILGAIGFFATVLAVTNVFRYLFPLWAAVVAYLIIRGFFFSPYVFPNAAMFRAALWLALAALIALWGALWVLKTRRRRFFL